MSIRFPLRFSFPLLDDPQYRPRPQQKKIEVKKIKVPSAHKPLMFGTKIKFTGDQVLETFKKYKEGKAFFYNSPNPIIPHCTDKADILFNAYNVLLNKTPALEQIFLEKNKNFIDLCNKHSGVSGKITDLDSILSYKVLSPKYTREVECLNPILKKILALTNPKDKETARQLNLLRDELLDVAKTMRGVLNKRARIKNGMYTLLKKLQVLPAIALLAVSIPLIKNIFQKMPADSKTPIA